MSEGTDEFEPGDRVVCIDNRHSPELIVGMTYVVDSQTTDEIMQLSPDPSGGKRWPYACDRFRLVEKAPAANQDAVILDVRARRYLTGLLREYVEENPDRSDAAYATELAARLEAMR